MNCQLVVCGPKGTRVLEVAQGTLLYHALRGEDVGLAAPCGGHCFCGKCRVRVVKPTSSSVLEDERRFISEEDIALGVRLACAFRIEEDTQIEIENRMDGAAILTDSVMDSVALESGMTAQEITLEPGSLENPRSDEAALRLAMGDEAEVPLSVLRALPGVARAEEGRLTVIREKQRLIDVRAGHGQTDYFGLAVDIGTTTLAAYLHNLRTGEKLGVASALNPQKAYGDDVISRMDFARQSPEALNETHQAIIGGVNALLKELCVSAGVNASQIVKATFCGNTVMMHLFVGVSPEHIAVVPFIPAFEESQCFAASQLGIDMHPEARVYTLPCVASYVGADTVGAVIASGMDQRDEYALLVDIGTNGEMVLGSKNALMACSTAAGPAFEGAHIRHGLGGVRGAISKVAVENGVLRVETIGGEQAKGICGSGIVDAVAALMQTGLLECTGRISPEYAPEENRGLVVEDEAGLRFPLAWEKDGAEQDIALFPKDVREVQLAKGAIAAGIEVMVREMGIHMDDIASVFLCGGFGSYVDRQSACAIGLIPPQLLDKIKVIGNAAGAGTEMALLSEHELARATAVRNQMQYIELSSKPDFQDLFVDKMMFE